MTSLGRSRSLQGSSGSLLLRDAQGKPFLAPGISGLQHFPINPSGVCARLLTNQSNAHIDNSMEPLNSPS